MLLQTNFVLTRFHRKLPTVLILLTNRICNKIPFKKVTHVIFDLDGVILDNEHLFTQAANTVLKKYGKAVTWETKRRTMGMPGPEAVQLLLKLLDINEDWQVFYNLLAEQHETLMPRSLPREGMTQLIPHLYQNRIPIGIATSSSPVSFQRKTTQCRALISLFNPIVCGLGDPDVRAGKPNPDIFLVCASRFHDKPAPGNCLVLEDAPSGVTAAIAAGMQCIMIPHRSLDRKYCQHATITYDSVTEIQLELFHLPKISFEKNQVNRLEIAPDRQLLASAGYQHIRMYDLGSSNPNPVINCEGVNKNVTSVGFEEHGKWMYSGSEDRLTRIWDYRSKALEVTRNFEASAPVTCVRLHPNQVELFIGDQGGVIHLWDIRSKHCEQFIPEGETMILDLDVDPKGELIAAVNNRGRCYIWSLTPGREGELSKMSPKKKFDAHKRQILRCKFSMDSELLVTTSADQVARIWRISDFSLLQELKDEHQRWVWDCAFSSDSQYLFTASSDGCAKLWNVKNGKMEREYTGHQKAVVALAFRDTSI